ncbi:MAG: FAD-dependent oxidoreductase [Planctomycetes bacterium]|jgi:NAD(P)H-nitrite reductase large subunit|nr:FAD-dependent oxidoreductase [Planctomycetota bacterium]
MRIGVVGAGHAGVEAAGQARRRGAEVVLYSGETVLPYFRPRVVALAFGQVQLDSIYLRTQDWYREHGIDLRLNSPAVHIDTCARTVVAGGHEERFDALILATGASPALLAFARDLPRDVIPLWGVSQSLVIRERLAGTRHLVILGGGISGVEAAVYGREAGLNVTLVEKMDRLMPLQLGPRAAAVLAHRLQNMGINVITSRYAETISKAEGRLQVILNDAGTLTGELVLTTVGAVRTLQLFAQAGLRTGRGIIVDAYQQTSVPGVFACGDIAQRDHLRTGTVLSAIETGRGAADNAVAFAQSRPLMHVPAPIAPLRFKHNDLEIQAVGPATGDGLEERVLPSEGGIIYRCVLLENDHPAAGPGQTLVGVQMVGSHDDFRHLADGLGKPWQAIP